MYREITFLELVPIVLGVLIWADSLKNKELLLHIDNLSLVYIVNHKSSKNNRIMKLVRLLVLHTLKYNIQIRAQHIPGIKNQIAGAISGSSRQGSVSWLLGQISIHQRYLLCSGKLFRNCRHATAGQFIHEYS